MDESARTFALQRETRERMAEFVETELDLGTTFCQLAMNADDPDRRRRSGANARRAFESASQFVVKMDRRQLELRSAIPEKLEKLKRLIEDLDS